MAKGKTIETPGYKELKAEIRAGQCRNLYVLFGEEDFLIEKLLESLNDLLIKPACRSLDRVVMDIGGQPSRLDPFKLQAELMTPPFISRRKLVIVRQSGWLASASGPRTVAAAAEEPAAAEQEDETEEADPASGSGAQKARQDQLNKMLEKLPDSACLVLVETKVDRRLRQLVATIEQKGVLAEIKKEQPGTLQSWIEVECRRRSLAIAPDAAASLIDRCDSSMRVIWQEMSKVFLYCAYAGCRTVDMPLISEISLPDLRGSIFDLTDALSAGQIERALLLVDTLVSQRQPIQLIQFMLVRHIRQLICAAESTRPERIASELKVMPFVANRLASQSRRFNLQTLEDLYARCFETDMLVKTGQISDRLALELLLVTASEQVRQPIYR